MTIGTDFGFCSAPLGEALFSWQKQRTQFQNKGIFVPSLQDFKCLSWSERAYDSFPTWRPALSRGAVHTHHSVSNKLADPRGVERAPPLFHPQRFEHLEIPRRPPWVGVEGRDLPPLEIVAVIHLMHLRVVYDQYPASLITHNHPPLQLGFSFFFRCILHSNIISYR